MNIIFVKRGHAYLENYTEDLLSKKERKEKKKKKKKTFNGRELHMYRPPWLVHETILYSISSVLHHKTESTTQLMEYFVTGYSMEKVHMVLLPI